MPAACTKSAAHLLSWRRELSVLSCVCVMCESGVVPLSAQLYLTHAARCLLTALQHLGLALFMDAELREGSAWLLLHCRI
jgi:hypothetical protein